jgi:hypothetical protein
MGIMGHGYGSEFHLLRYLGYHRGDLNRAIEQQTGGRVLDWRDFGFVPRGKFPHLDAEWKGLEFLGPDLEAVKAAWAEFWPRSGTPPNWDAVGFLQLDSHTEFILVEAKAHLWEVRSDCGAREDGGLPMIRKAFAETVAAHGFKADPEKWLNGYYQSANRLATLHFLAHHNVLSRLVFIYFIGDDAGRYKKPVRCPKDEQEWSGCLREMYHHLGMTGSSRLEQRVHRLFLPVCGPAGESLEHLAARGECAG